jgi:predicted metal-dependent HD superfamily phosphohydrolase
MYRKADSADIARLRAIWNEAVGSAHPKAAAAIFDGIIARYSEPHRAYHNVGHLVELFENWDEHKKGLRSKRRVALAIFFHDAVYDVSRRDNEERSAVLALTELNKLGYNMQTRKRIADLIRMTASHKAPKTDKDAALMLDLDMKVLGAEPADYDRYAAAIEQEYASIFSPLSFARGRLAMFVLPTLREPRLFETQEFEDRYAEKARANLEREKKALVSRLPKHN